MQCDAPDIIKIYLENRCWAKGILPLDDTLESKQCIKVCHDVTQANLHDLTNTILHIKSVYRLPSGTKEENGSIEGLLELAGCN
jgi:hypothetical protein